MSVQEAEKMKNRVPEGWTLESLKEEAAKLESVVILFTSWYPEIMEPMMNSAQKYLMDMGVKHSAIVVRQVPGSFELPLAAKTMIQANKPSLVVALGTVIRGDTPHFDFVCSSVAKGLMDLQLETGVPLGFGVLTVDNKEQAVARIDKGFEAAQAAFFMHLLSLRAASALL